MIQPELNKRPLLRVCAVVPVYRHVQFVKQVYDQLQEHKLTCFIVNDGNSEEDSAELKRLFAEEKNAVVIDLYPNSGKGVASYKGFKTALDHGYSHAVQVDADGQHDISDFPKLFSQAQLNPEALITGVPLYDDSVPKARFYSRYLTHFWVWVETLSFEIKDSMCGFRVYPLAATVNQLDKRLYSHMVFDTSIMVRLFWDGVKVVSVPTRVIYPKDGVSNFRMLRDNFRITKMHIGLVMGMLLRAPKLIARKFTQK